MTDNKNNDIQNLGSGDIAPFIQSNENLSQRDNETHPHEQVKDTTFDDIVSHVSRDTDSVSQNEAYSQNEPHNFPLDNTTSHVSRDTPSISLEEFPESVFENLPAILKKPFTEVIQKRQQQELALVVLLAALSGMLPNYFTVYDGSKLSANLYLAVVAPFGEGKGFTRFIKRIPGRVHERKLQEAEDDVIRYQNELNECEEPEKSRIQKPRLFRHFVPANNSKTGLIFLLSQNDGRGTLFETEIDTLVEGLKQDFGNFSDLLRNGFQNEAHGLFRKTNNESIDIEKIFLSVIITGTLGQLFSLIPSIENGLFSRFLYFFMTPDENFHNVFDPGKLTLEEYFDDYAVYFDNLHLRLEQRELNPVYFSLQANHQERFRSYFQKLKTELSENVNPAFGGVVHRLALMCCRIAQILSFYRQASNEIPDEIICEDIDFENALTIIKVFKSHTLKVYYSLPQMEEEEQGDQNADAKKEENIIKAKELHAEGISYRRISEILFGKSTKHQTIFRWVNQKSK